MLISYSIRDKTALNVLIYLQAPPDSLSLCVTDALSNTLLQGEGEAACWWCRHIEVWWWCGVCSWRREGRAGQQQASKTKQGKDRKQFKTLY